MTLAWMAFAWTRPAFPADAPPQTDPPAPTSQVSDGGTSGSKPDEVATFLDAGTDTTGTSQPKDKPSSSLRLAPIAIRLGGILGYDIEQRTTRGGNALLQQRALLTLRGRAASYIWQPWIAKVNSNVSFTTSKSRTDDSSSSNNTISGQVGLFLVPYSRYPFDASLSRNQNYSGPGIGSLISQTTLFTMNQNYRPRSGKEGYKAGYTRSKTDSGGSDIDLQTGFNLGVMSNRFDQNQIEADATRERDRRFNNGSSKLLDTAIVHHRYQPSGALSMTNNASLRSLTEQTKVDTTNSRDRELNSTISFQPQLPYSVIGSARVNVSDQSTLAGSSQTSSSNLNVGANYRPSQRITMSASANGNISDKNGKRTQSFSTSQTINANYPLAATNLGAYRYTSQVSGSVSNRTSNRSSSLQSLSVGPGHSLTRTIDLNGGKLSLGLTESVSVSQTTQSQASSSLSHSASANWQRTQGRSDTSWRLSARDTRSLSRTQDIYQSIDMSGAVREEFGRYSTLSGSLSMRAMRQVSIYSQTANSTSSSASLHYGHQRAFDVPRLVFDSALRTYSQAVIPVFAGTPSEQGPITWENTLTYNIGLLNTIFRVNLSKESDGTTQSLIALSLKRFF